MAVSSAMPSLNTRPNSFQNVANFSAWFAARSSSRLSTRLTAAVRMVWTSRDCCRISRETLSGRSLESITPLTKRRYAGINCSASSMMKTRRTYNLMPWR